MTSTAYSLIWNSMYGVSRWKVDMCVPECHGVNSLEVMHFRLIIVHALGVTRIWKQLE